MDDLGAGIQSITRTVDGRLLVDYWVDGYLVATASIGPDCRSLVDVHPAMRLDVVDVLKFMAALNFAASRAAQMSFAALGRPR
jgi:hypothetical protein